jgi:hypothetical protein
MNSPRDVFLAHVEHPETDAEVEDLRRQLIEAKTSTIARVNGLDEIGLKEVMPDLYRQLISTTIQIATRVGAAVGLALEMIDESNSKVSISSFSRLVREQMTATGVAIKNRHTTSIARVVAEVEACRLAWRHNHEFLSWLAFRRNDARYPAEDRRARLEAFKVQTRLLQAREGVVGAVGRDLAVALESHDRFMLANRWLLSPSAEHGVERYIWPLLSYQDRTHVLLETARFDYDALQQEEASPEELELARVELVTLQRDALAAALSHLPDSVGLRGPLVA